MKALLNFKHKLCNQILILVLYAKVSRSCSFSTSPHLTIASCLSAMRATYCSTNLFSGKTVRSGCRGPEPPALAIRSTLPTRIPDQYRLVVQLLIDRKRPCLAAGFELAG